LEFIERPSYLFIDITHATYSIEVELIQ